MLLIKKTKVVGLILLALILGLNSNLCAQETGSIINSNPPGAAITLDGEYQLSATTPVRLPDNINGRFKLKAMLPGYESWSGDVVLLPGQQNRFSFRLAPKTRFKAMVRSLFIPGWGQYYADEKKKALVINIATLGMGVGAVIADYDFRRKRDDYNQAKIDYSNASTYEEREELRELVVDKNRDAYDAETLRNSFLYATAAIWAYNVLDAIIFFPDNKLQFHQESMPIKEAQIEPDVNLDQVGLKLTASF